MKFILLIFIKSVVSLENYIYEMARYSKYTYRSYNLLHKNPITNFSKDTGIYAFEDKEECRMIISCRGSVSLRDWKVNLNFLPKKHPKVVGKFHRGYLNSFLDTIKSPEFDKLNSKINEFTNDICITGHSSGAIKSILLGGYLATEYTNKNIKVVGFGSPNIGSIEFYNNLQKLNNFELTLIRLCDDIIPCIGAGKQPLYENTIDIVSDNCSLNPFKSHNMERYERKLLTNFI